MQPNKNLICVLWMLQDSACSGQSCSNQCCSQNPCLHGGTCTELCKHAKHKFNCSCAMGYFGKFCQKRQATSCKEHLEKYTRAESGVYSIFDPIKNFIYEAFCDFNDKNGFVWTLFESFSLANKNEFAVKPFYVDYPVNENAFDWNKFRLSFSRMKMISSNSTHVRATCNFNTAGLNYTDYLRAKITDIDVIRLKIDGCKKYEYINIRGYSCGQCTAHFAQIDIWHAHVDSYYGSQKGCQLTSPLTGAVRNPGGEDNFGFYQTVNPVHRCSSSLNSTTQWWFGEN